MLVLGVLVLGVRPAGELDGVNQRRDLHHHGAVGSRTLQRGLEPFLQTQSVGHDQLR